MPHDDLPTGGLPDEPVTLEVPFSEEGLACLEAAARQRGCSLEELLLQAVQHSLDHPEEIRAYRARQAIVADALEDLAQRAATTNRRTERLSAKLQAAGRPPTALPAGTGMVPLPPAAGAE